MGYLDDIKIKVGPNSRLTLMIVFLIIYIIFLPIEIKYIDLIFLNSWLDGYIYNELRDLINLTKSENKNCTG